jgi:hypothetical protein
MIKKKHISELTYQIYMDSENYLEFAPVPLPDASIKLLK